jgi:hypothetical protein
MTTAKQVKGDGNLMRKKNRVQECGTNAHATTTRALATKTRAHAAICRTFDMQRFGTDTHAFEYQFQDKEGGQGPEQM